MSTYSSLVSLQRYLENQVGIKCYIGAIDFASMQYPCFNLVPDETDSIDESPLQSRIISNNFGIKIKLINNREPESLERTLHNYDKFLTVIRNFKDYEGHFVEADNTKEYTDNTYEITWRYNLRIRLQNT